MYHFDPSNPPTKAGRYSNSSRKKPERQKSLTSSAKPNYREHANNTNNTGNSDSEKSVVLPNKPTLTQPKVNVMSNDDDQTDLLPMEAPPTCESPDDDCTTTDIEHCELNCKF